MKSADPTKSVRGTFLLITPADTLFTNLKMVVKLESYS